MSWRTHGFDPEYRHSKTLGPNSNPRGWSLPRHVLASRARAFQALPWPSVVVAHTDAASWPVEPGAIVYMDPNYRGTLSYKNTLTRASVVEIARAHASAGCSVFVSEGEPVTELVDDGWSVQQLLPGRGNTLGQVVEHVTFLLGAGCS